jgi:Flp pilus assembly protein protease CpaA
MDPHRIPNWLSIAIAAGFYGWAVARGWPIGTIAAHTLLAVVVTVAGLWMGIGGGAVKLTAAIVLWLPLPDALSFMSLAFGTCTIGVFIANRLGRKHIPYWPFAAGALLVLYGPAALQMFG